MERSLAWNAGYTAWSQCDKEHCPHPQETAERNEWIEGFDTAALDDFCGMDIQR